MPRPHPHDIPKRNRIWKPEISKCDFFFCRTWRQTGRERIPNQGHTAQAAPKKFVNSFNSLLRRLRPLLYFVVFRPNHAPKEIR